MSYIYIDKVFSQNWVGGNSSYLFYKNDMCPLHVRSTCFFFNYNDKVERNFIQKACTSHMLFKNHVFLT
jgi:hypothetical protein